MKVTIHIPDDVVAQAVLDGLERAHRDVWVGGWAKKMGEGRFNVTLTDEARRPTATLRITPTSIETGVDVFAAKYPDHFGKWMKNPHHTECCLLLLQCVLFGEEKYA